MPVSCVKIAKMLQILIFIVSLLTEIHSQTVCIPDDTMVDNLVSSNPGAKLNLTMTVPSLSIISCATLETSNKSDFIGGHLILSDSPEYPSDKGKLYEDASLLPTYSPNRIFMYHVNGSPVKNLKFAIFVTNLDQNEIATLTVVQKGVAEPSKNYILSGQHAFYLWLKSEVNSSQHIVQPLQFVQLDDGYYQYNVQPDELLHGIYDYHMTTNHKLTLCALETDDDPEVCLNLPLLPRDRHVRGTFPSSNKHWDIAHNLSIVMMNQFPIADGATDEFIKGIDATDESIQINSGNYGVLYRLNFNIFSSSNNSKVGYFVNPRGGIWAGAVGIVDQESFNSYLLPEVDSGILRNNWEGALIGKFNSGRNPVILWMPTGGSNLPIRIVGIHYSIEEDDEPEPTNTPNCDNIHSIGAIFKFLLIFVVCKSLRYVGL